ncbi:TolC family protein [candidate division KSB1 bacterium]|nr:TolC family protein [candidate division KSB1 bacterium]
MKAGKYFIGYLILILIVGQVFAQSPDQLVLTIDQSVDIALENNPEVLMAEKRLSKAHASIWEAYAAILPSINGTASFQKSWEIQENTIPNFIKVMLGPDFPGVSAMPDFVKLSFGLENTFIYGASLTQPLFLGGAGIAGVQMANAAKDVSAYSLESTRQNLIYQTAGGFYNCLLAKELVQVQTEALEQAKANLDMVVKKYNAGGASGFDKMRAEVEVANILPQEIAAKHNYQAALTGLRTVLGLPKETHIEIDGSLEFQVDELDGIVLTDLQGASVENRPELFAFSAQKRIASKGITIARSQFMPKVFFATDYSFLAMTNNYELSQDDFSKGFTSAVSLQIPLFNAFKNHKQYQKAQLDYKITLDAEKQIHDGIAAEVELAYNQFKVAKEKYQAAKESTGLAEEAMRLANLMYDEGVSTQLDVMGSQLALTRARLNYVSALYEYQMARYGLRRVSGTLKGVL